MKNMFRIAILVGATALLAACAAEITGKSGFLKDYSQLKPDPKIEGALRYEKPGASLTSYRKFIIYPVVIHFAPNAKGVGLDPENLVELTRYFRTEAVKKLSKNYAVVDKAGAGVMRIRIALTSIETTTPIANIHPAMKLSGLGLGGASMEAEVLDSVSGERLAAVVESRAGDRMSIGAGFSKFGHAKQVMDMWIDRFVARLDKARGAK
ncbi:MAG: DUF3313 domain-containing protein [Proteobacteria bacterium]|nr:DUF3313 domain-containing protein [Pseudomonadota bacterium]